MTCFSKDVTKAVVGNEKDTIKSVLLQKKESKSPGTSYRNPMAGAHIFQHLLLFTYRKPNTLEKYYALKTSEVLLLWMYSLAFPLPAEMSRCEELLYYCLYIFQTFSTGRLCRVFHCPPIFWLFYSCCWRSSWDYTILSYSLLWSDY